MGSTYTTNGGIEKIGSGEQSGTWGDTTNTNFDIIDKLTNGVTEIDVASNTTSNLATSDGTVSDGMSKVLVYTTSGTQSQAHTVTITITDAEKLYFINNTLSQDLRFVQDGSTPTDCVVAANTTGIIYARGNTVSGSARLVNLSNSLIVKGIKTSGSDDATIDAAGGDFKFSVSDTEILRITNSSSDVIIKPVVDAKDIIFQQRDGTEVARVEDDGTFNVVTGKLAINATAISSTAAELNKLDGDTANDSSITVADSDGILVDDGGTMKKVPASDIKTYASGNSLVPAGALMPYAGTSAPTGFLLCHGQAISRTTYADLFSAIGTTYGAGDGSSTFALPDLRGRVVAGQDDMGGASANRLTDQTGGLNGDTLGDTGGSETHTLTTAQLASHTHTFSDTDSHTVSFPRTFISGAANNSVNVDGSGERHDGGTLTVSISGTTSSTGSGSAHNNVQPTIILNYIIKT
jgi:microcystin-dependent protein